MLCTHTSRFPPSYTECISKTTYFAKLFTPWNLKLVSKKLFSCDFVRKINYRLQSEKSPTSHSGDVQDWVREHTINLFTRHISEASSGSSLIN